MIFRTLSEVFYYFLIDGPKRSHFAYSKQIRKLLPSHKTYKEDRQTAMRILKLDHASTISAVYPLLSSNLHANSKSGPRLAYDSMLV
jgi:hypothetical protein